MSFLLPALVALAPGGAGDSLALHPADALAYFETPDIPALVAAYDEAPVLRLLADETLTKALKPIIGEDFDPAGMWAELRATHLAPMSSMSVSIGTQTGDFTSLLAEFGKQDTSQYGIYRLRGAIEGHRSESGAYPASLDDLGADAETADAWGNTYQYTLSPEGDIDLGCLGADGAAGGRGINADFGQGGPNDEARFAAFRIQLVLDFIDAGTATAYLDSLVSEAPGSGNDVGFGSAPLVGHDPLVRRAIGDLTTLQHGARVYAFNAPDSEAGLLARLNASPGGSLAGSASWAQGGQFPTLAEGSAVVLDGFSDLGPGLMEMLDLPELGPALSLAQGLLGTSISMLTSGGRWRIALNDGRFVTDGFSPAVSGEDAFELFGQKPLDPSCMTWVQPEALVAWGAHLDRAALLAAIPEMFDDGREGGGETVLGELDDSYGFRPDRDLIAPLAPTAMLNLPKLASFMAAPDMRLSVGIDDVETFTKGLDGLVQYVSGELAGSVTSKVSTYRKHKVYSFGFVSSGGGMAGLPIDPVAMIKPTVAVLEDRVLITLAPTYAKREIKRMSEIAKALSKGEEAVTEHPTFGVEHLPAGSSEVAYADWGQFLAGIYGTARGLVPLLATMGVELDFDPMSLPEPEVLFAHFEPSLRSKRPVSGGFLHRSESSFGPELLVAVAGAAGYGFGGASAAAAPRRGGERLEVVPVDAAEASSGQALVDETQAALGAIQVGLTVYKLDAASYPAQLADLVKATDAYPSGFLDSGAVPTDAWGNALHYAVTEAGYELRSYGADGVDQKGAGDDVTLP